MSYGQLAQLKLTWCHALLIAALPTACAVGVEPDFGDSTDPGDTGGGAGASSGGTLPLSGSASGGQINKAGSSSTSGGTTSSPFGGTASTGGKGGSSSGGAGAGGSSSGGTGGSSAGGSGGTGGSSAGGSGGGTGGTGTCACPKTLTWADNTNLSFGPGDCLDVAGKIYLYTGVKAQTWANKDCNPTMQLSWCSDVGADYKFTLCK